jgi:hypothetical protein
MRISFIVIPCNFYVNPERIPLTRNQFLGNVSGKTWICKNVNSVCKPHESTHSCWSNYIIIIYTEPKSGFCVTSYSLKYQRDIYCGIHQQPTFVKPYSLTCVSVLMLHHLQCHSTLVHCYTQCPSPIVCCSLFLSSHLYYCTKLLPVFLLHSLHQLNSQFRLSMLHSPATCNMSVWTLLLNIIAFCCCILLSGL